MQTWGNRADALVRQAELMAESNAEQAGQGEARQVYEQGMEAYSTACSLTSSEQGDDLPGLLHNWGVGLSFIAQHAQVQLQSCHCTSVLAFSCQTTCQSPLCPTSCPLFSPLFLQTPLTLVPDALCACFVLHSHWRLCAALGCELCIRRFHHVQVLLV